MKRYKLKLFLIAIIACILTTVTCVEIKPNNFNGNELDNDDKQNNFADAKLTMHAKYLQRSSIIFGLATIANGSNVKRDCYENLKKIQQGILQREAWALKVLDASATKPAGFIFGNDYWLGSRETCQAVQRPVNIKLSTQHQRVMNFGIINEISPFDMDYRVLYVKHNSPWQVEVKFFSNRMLNMGLCLPNVCSAQEIEQLMTAYIEQGFFVESEIYNMKPEVVYMKDLKLSESFYKKKTLKLLSITLIFTVLMMLCASLSRESQESTISEVKNQNVKKEKNIVEIPNVKSFIKCFDLKTNWWKMFKIKENATTEIPAINGLRVVCATFITFFHILYIIFLIFTNNMISLKYIQRCLTGALMVDVFFTISGFLRVYNFLRNKKQMETIRQNNLFQNLKIFFNMLFHRYLRIAPLYFVVICVVDLLFAYFGEVSVLHIVQRSRMDEHCSQHWWRNLFFIQNLYNYTEMCVDWTWSLGCDMQFFIMATIVLFIYAKNPRAARITTVALLAANCLWSYRIGLKYNYETTIELNFTVGNDVYTSPYVRCLPYILGSITAWYLLEKQQKPQKSSSKSSIKNILLWSVSISIIACSIYGTFMDPAKVSPFFAISAFVFGRSMLSLAACWLILDSAMGRWNWTSALLEAKVFQHLNRVTYANYILNLLVIYFFTAMNNTIIYPDPFIVLILVCGYIVVIYVIAVVFSLAFEMPYCNWSSVLLKRDKQKKII